MAALVYLETFSNQRFIFATNRLRQNVGASELTFRAGTRWVLEALGVPASAASSPAAVRRHLLSDANPPFEDGEGAEIVYAVSGKALVLVDDAARGRELVSAVTRRALREAPGLELVGAVSDGFDWDPASYAGELHRRIDAVARRQAALRARLPGPAARAPRLPVTASCDSSGQPAAHLGRVGGRSERRSPEVAAKHRAAEEGLARMRGLAPEGMRLARVLDEVIDDDQAPDEPAGGEAVADADGWIGVVHADGNGVGSLFAAFDQHVTSCLGRPATARDYVDWLRRFSLALDLATTEAFRDAVATSVADADDGDGDGDGDVRLLPLILGGDDLTVVCTGAQALPFTVAFLQRFEAHTAEALADVGDVLPAVAEQAFGVGHLAASAGVAITKPHFPFFQGYELAGQLAESAKQVKHHVQHVVGDRDTPVPCGSLDTHVLYDTADADLTRIRAQLTVEAGDTPAVLTARPYVVTDPERSSATVTDESRAWIAPRRWSRLHDAFAALTGPPDPGAAEPARLPRTQVHRLRHALFHGPERAEAELARARGRYGDALRPLLADAPDGDTPGVFWSETDARGQPRYVTRLLDALELCPFAAVGARQP